MNALVVTLMVLAGAGLKVAPAPGVVVLNTRASPEVSQREKKLYDALTLALDSFAVILAPPSKDTFASLTLPEQVALALPETESSGAVAVVWLVRPAPRQLMVHLVARNTGRTLVKTVETTSGPDAEATLALVVRELLGAAFLFEPPASLPPGLGSVVQGVREQVAPQAAVPAPKPVDPMTLPVPVGPSVRLSLETAAGVLNQVGAPVRGSLSVSRSVLSFERVVWSLTGEVGAGPLQAAPFGLWSGQVLAGIEAFVPVTSGRAFGPVFSVAAGLRWQRGSSGGDTLDVVSFTASAHAGVRGLVRVSDGVHLCFDAALGLRPFPSRFLNGSAVLWREGWGEVRAGVGLFWEVR